MILALQSRLLTHKIITSAQEAVDDWLAGTRRLRPEAFIRRRAQARRSASLRLLSKASLKSFVKVVPLGLRVGLDDFLNSCAALWTAERI